MKTRLGYNKRVDKDQIKEEIEKKTENLQRKDNKFKVKR